MDVKTKFGVTIFSNGDMDILKESLPEDLWRDYQFFCKKADSHRHKQSPKASLLVRRYERTAIITLFTFFFDGAGQLAYPSGGSIRRIPVYGLSGPFGRLPEMERERGGFRPSAGYCKPL